MELELSEFSIRVAIEQALALVRERAALHRITIAVDVDPTLDLITSDELRFKQVMLNLLSNAVKFTPDGGRVAVQAVHAREWVTVTVTDNGIGIPQEDQERIFESFHQGRRGAPREEGTGLGLTLCRRIVTLMGGVMALRSEVGAGSTFSFSIPIREAAGPPDAIGPETDDHVVVVIDDDRKSLDLMSAYLDGRGVRVVQAGNGVEGLETIRRLRPAAALLDIRLPDIDGWKVLEQLRGDPATRSLPVIIASILDEKSRGLAAGASDYLIKPVARDDLLEALRRVHVLPGAGVGWS
jgi:CheY-like chemotaxis protein/anti-sigma regulatory factor (Ser/Thr protein kinase)